MGKKNSTSGLPRRSADEIWLPSAAVKVKSGAREPDAGIAGMGASEIEGRG